jgi:hypothetical protein
MSTTSVIGHTSDTVMYYVNFKSLNLHFSGVTAVKITSGVNITFSKCDISAHSDSAITFTTCVSCFVDSTRVMHVGCKV